MRANRRCVIARGSLCGIAGVLGTLFFVAACQSTPEAPREVTIEQEAAAEARVRAIDPTTRELTLEREDGVQMVIVAGPEVRNFEQIRVGNTVTARYAQTLSARLLEPDEVAAEPEVGMVASRAEEGEAPAGGIAAGVRLSVTVESVDRDQHLVVFTDPYGQLHAVRAQREQGKAFVKGLKAGDRVELLFGEALALTVD